MFATVNLYVIHGPCEYFNSHLRHGIVRCSSAFEGTGKCTLCNANQEVQTLILICK